MPKPFDYVSDISSDKNNIWEDGSSEREYSPYLTNRAFSYHVDTIIDANLMNQMAHLPSKLQFLYFFNMVRPKRRFAKWSKKDDSITLKAVQAYFQINAKRAQEYVKNLCDEDKRTLTEWYQGKLKNGK